MQPCSAPGMGLHHRFGKPHVIIPRDGPKQGKSTVGTGSHPYAEDTRARTRTYTCARMQTTTSLSACNLGVLNGLEQEPGDGFGDFKGCVTVLNHAFVSWRTQYSDPTHHQTKLGGIITAVSAQMCNETCSSSCS